MSEPRAPMTLSGEHERALWRDVLVASIAAGRLVSIAAEQADEAVLAYRARRGGAE